MSCLIAVCLTLGIVHSQYIDQSLPEFNFKLQVAHEDSPVYLWTGYENVGIRMLGQEIARTAIFSLGVGAEKDIGDFFVFGEIGYGLLKSSVNKVRQQEVIYTELVSRHNVFNRPVPLDLRGPYDQDSYETIWEIHEGFLGKLGVGYHFGSHVNVTLAYRPFFVREHIEIWDEERRNAGKPGWWQESRNRNLSSIELGLSYEF